MTFRTQEQWRVQLSLGPSTLSFRFDCGSWQLTPRIFFLGTVFCANSGTDQLQNGLGNFSNHVDAVVCSPFQNSPSLSRLPKEAGDAGREPSTLHGHCSYQSKRNHKWTPLLGLWGQMDLEGRSTPCIVVGLYTFLLLLFVLEHSCGCSNPSLAPDGRCL